MRISCNATCALNIGIKHGFSCINIRQVPREVLKTEAEGTWRMLMHWKNMFDRYYCIKTKNICYISRYFLHYFVSPFHRCLAKAICMDHARSSARQNTSRNGSKSVAPVRAYWKLRSRALTARELIELITCDTAFYAIIKCFKPASVYSTERIMLYLISTKLE